MRSADGLTVAGLRAEPGSKTTGLVTVDLGTGSVDLPLALVCGTRPGPRLAISAGIHGGEYVSIPALRRAIEQIEPSAVTGSIVAVLNANPAAFFARSVYVTPPDDKNLNRMFPGDPDGSPTERLAAWLFQNVISPSDRLIDMHSGDLNEELVSFVGLPAPVEPAVDSVAESMAAAYGLDYVIGGGMSTGTAVGAARSAKIPAIWTEVGGRGSWTATEVQLTLDGLLRAAASAGVYDGHVRPAARTPRRLSRNVWVRSEVGGCLYVEPALGDHVEDGQTLGRIEDFFGNQVQELRATMTGMVFYLVTSLAITSGDPILGIGA